jgi:hypothetical protein
MRYGSPAGDVYAEHVRLALGRAACPSSPMAVCARAETPGLLGRSPF